MVWDKNVPAGNTRVRLGDDAIRENQAQLEAAKDLEHYFQTGGTQTGRHKFPRGTSTGSPNDRDDAATAFQNGSVFYADDVRLGVHVLQVRDSGAWKNVDVEPLDGSGNPTLPRVNAQSEFTVVQFSDHAAVTPGAGTPNTLALDLDLPPSKFAVLNADTEIQTPTNLPAGLISATIVLELIMGSGGGHTITWQSGGFAAVAGAAPAIDTTNGARTLCTLTYTQLGRWVVSTQPGFAAI